MNGTLWQRLVAQLMQRDPALDRDQIVLLQLLRGIAASGVVIEHLLERYAPARCDRQGLG